MDTCKIDKNRLIRLTFKRLKVRSAKKFDRFQSFQFFTSEIKFYRHLYEIY